MTTDLQYTCSHCGAELSTPFHGGVNVRLEPELREAVRDGSLFVRECPYCGARNLLRGQFLYHDPDGRLMVWLLPDGDPSEERLERIDAQTAGLDGYVLRRVADVGSLIEKIGIHDAGLDDAVMELCKYVTRMELAENTGNAAILDAPLRFFRLEGADNRILLTYPLDGAMQVAEVGFNVYEDSRGIFARNPSLRPAPGFARIDADWIARFFR